MAAVSWKEMKGQMGQSVLGMTLVLSGVHVNRSVEASSTLVWPACPWIISDRPLLEISVAVSLGCGTSTARTLLWLN